MLSDILGLATSFFSKIGDQVKGYDIKSSNTDQKIDMELAARFPAPVSVQDAKNLLALLESDWLGAEEKLKAKGGKDRVISTYIQKYQNYKAAYVSYINSGSGLDNAEMKINEQGKIEMVKGSSTSSIVFILLAVAGFFLIGRLLSPSKK